MRRQHELSQRVIDNSPEKKLHGGQLDITSLKTYQSLEFRSEKCMASHTDTQPGTCIRIQSDGLREDENLLMNFLMICIENQRLSRVVERVKIAKQSQQLIVSRLTQDYSQLRQISNIKSAEFRLLSQQSANLKIRLSQLEILLKDKELQLVTKDKQLTQLRLSLHQTKAKKQCSQNSLIRSLQSELSSQKIASGQILNKKQQCEFQLRLLQQRQNQWKSRQAALTNKNQQLELELSLLQSTKIQLQHSTQLVIQQMTQENESTLAKVTQVNKMLVQNQQVCRKLESQNEALLQQIKKMNCTMNDRQEQCKKVEQNCKERRAVQSQQLKKQLLVIEEKMGQLAVASERQRQLECRTRDVERLAKERDNLHQKLTMLMEQMTRLQRVIVSKEQCLNCQNLTMTNSLMNRRIGVLEQSLLERGAEIDRLLSVKMTKTVKTGKGDKINMRELKCSVEQLKGSTERVSQLLDVSNMPQPPNYSQTAVQRSFIFQSM